jgi:CDP-diacylglycerol--glycerol-3-phosphate 3-phosphatidyltransferase
VDQIKLMPHRAPERLVGPVVRRLAALGVTPDMITFVSIGGNIAAAVLAANGQLIAAGIVMLVFSAMDFLDGALARATGKASNYGAMLDSVFDRTSEAAVLFGILLYELDQGHSEESALIFAAVFGSLMVSYVRARAEGLGIDLREGLFTRPERVVLLAAALITGWLRLGLWILAVLTLLTAAQRFVSAARTLRTQEAAAATTESTDDAEEG